MTILPTRAQVEAEPAGRRLDAWVAALVMGQPWQGGNPVPNYDGRWPWPPPYSRDIAAAWEVVGWLRRRSPINLYLGHDKERGKESVVVNIMACSVGLEADSSPLALCRVALLVAIEEGAVWETANERTVRWNKEQTEYLWAKLKGKNP